MNKELTSARRFFFQLSAFLLESIGFDAANENKTSILNNLLQQNKEKTVMKQG